VKPWTLIKDSLPDLSKKIVYLNHRKLQRTISLCIWTLQCKKVIRNGNFWICFDGCVVRFS